MNRIKPFLSVIIPVYNEEKRLHNLRKVIEYTKNKKFTSEIIIVNDGSTDQTNTLLKEFITAPNIKIISYEDNKGKGFAIKIGMLSATGDYRLFLDIDLSTPISEFDKFIKYINKYPVVIGSRRLKDARIIKKQAKLRESMGKLFTNLSKLCLRIKVSDFTCGFKCFSEESAENIFSKITISRWGFDCEVLYIAKKLGYFVYEIAITWENDEMSKVRFPQDIFYSFLDLLKIQHNDFKGIYKKT